MESSFMSFVLIDLLESSQGQNIGYHLSSVTFLAIATKSVVVEHPAEISDMGIAVGGMMLTIIILSQYQGL